VKVEDIEEKLSLLQGRLKLHRGREDLTAILEDSYWAEVCRLRSLKCYDRLPPYVSWLADYHGSDRDGPIGTKYLRTNNRG
jgi:hypothetical protein